MGLWDSYRMRLRRKRRLIRAVRKSAELTLLQDNTRSIRPDDILLVGRETAGVPPDVAALADARLRIPMRQGVRSINVAIAAAMVLGEAYRQTEEFEELQ